MKNQEAARREAAPGDRDGWDSWVTAEIARFLAQYQALEITVRTQDAQNLVVRVHVPYMTGTVTWLDQPETLSRQRPRHQARLQRVAQARREASPELQAFFQRWFYEPSGEERLVAIGRSGPEEIRKLLQAAVDAGLVSTFAGQTRLNGDTLREWLQRYGIGVDCSALVQHTLTHLLRASYAAAGETPASPHEVDVGWMRAATVHRRLIENANDRRFDLVATPAQARPGDILVSTGHSRIIIEIQSDADGARIVTLAESTSRTDLVGQAHFVRDVGPRRYHVRYPKPDQAIRAQLPEHKRTSEATFEFEPSEWEQQFLIARNRRFAAIRQRHTLDSANPVHPFRKGHP